MRVAVLTPMGQALDEDVDELVAPLVDGWIGVRPGHEPFTARLMRGHVVLRTGEHQRIVATIGGVLSVDRDTATLLTGAALPDYDLATLERANEDEVVRIESLEREAERHFGRVYRALARTLDPRRSLRG
jgi:F-type H+-transporting ATPase subunit epsilon